MICSDERLTKVCQEMFHFLKTGGDRTEIHHKPVSRRVHQTGSMGCSITVGFLEVQMVWKPLRRSGEGTSGSDEGANVFIRLPFKDPQGGLGADQMQVVAYYSERTGDPVLSISEPEATMTKQAGPKRVLVRLPEPDLTSPLA